MTMYAYVVRGSEDGNFAVTSRKRRAFDMATRYVKNGVDPLEFTDNLLVTIDNIRTKYTGEVYYSTTGPRCTIEKFEIE